MKLDALLQLSEALGDIDNIDLFWEKIEQELEQYGITGMCYAAGASNKELTVKDPHQSLFLKTNYPKIYMETFGEDSYLENDLSVALLTAEPIPMFWHHEPNWDEMTRAQISDWKICDDIGFEVGITVPLPMFSPTNFGGVGICASEHTPKEFDKIWTEKSNSILQIISLLDVGMRQQHLSAVIGLTRREKEVMTWLASGLRPDEIAKRMGIGYRTVDKYIVSAKHRLNATTRDQAVAKALLFKAIDI